MEEVRRCEPPGKSRLGNPVQWVVSVSVTQSGTPREKSRRHIGHFDNLQSCAAAYLTWWKWPTSLPATIIMADYPSLMRRTWITPETMCVDWMMPAGSNWWQLTSSTLAMMWLSRHWETCASFHGYTLQWLRPPWTQVKGHCLRRTRQDMLNLCWCWTRRHHTNTTHKPSLYQPPCLSRNLYRWCCHLWQIWNWCHWWQCTIPTFKYFEKCLISSYLIPTI